MNSQESCRICQSNEAELVNCHYCGAFVCEFCAVSDANFGHFCSTNCLHAEYANDAVMEDVERDAREWRIKCK